MGQCFQSEGHRQSLLDPEKHALSKQLDVTLSEAKEESKFVSKVLLLGPGESGKSTIFKQMRCIYGQGFSEDSRRGFRSVIHQHIIRSIQHLIEMSDTLSRKGVSGVSPARGPGVSVLRELKEDAWIDPELATVIDTLWHDASIQTTWARRNLYQVSDSTEYFLGRIRAIGAEDYIPTLDDIFRVRVRTKGIVEDEFKIEKRSINVFDAGGQRSERKKWMSAFDGVTAVLFVAALSEYDMVLEEAPDTNRLDEALYLFDNICNSRWFIHTHMILFLNKSDLFRDKLTRVPLSEYFPEFRGPNEYDPALAFIRDKFERKNQNIEKNLFVHITCATDTEMCRAVFAAITHIILTNSLKQAGLT